MEEDGAEALPFVGSFDPSGDPGQNRSGYAEGLGIDEGFARKSKSWTDQIGRLARVGGEGESSSSAQIVGGNTNRHLDVDEFRGFALCDVSRRWSSSTRRIIKRLRYSASPDQLAHLWDRTERGVQRGGGRFSRGLTHLETEALCDKAARRPSSSRPPNASPPNGWRGSEPSAEIQRLAARFRISSIVALRRALESDLVRRSDFATLLEEVSGLQVPARRAEDEGGGDFYKTFGARNGEVSPRSSSGRCGAGGSCTARRPSSST